MSDKSEIDPEILEDMKLDILDMDVTLNNVVASFNMGLKTGVTLNLLNMVMRGHAMELRSSKSYVTVR